VRTLAPERAKHGEPLGERRHEFLVVTVVRAANWHFHAIGPSTIDSIPALTESCSINERMFEYRTTTQSSSIRGKRVRAETKPAPLKFHRHLKGGYANEQPQA
jgi:hypothetical protein